MPDTPRRPPSRAGRRRSPGVALAAPRRRSVDLTDRFFRHLVSSMRNGVIAVRRDGTVALMNSEAYRIFSLTPRPGDVGRPFTDLLRTRTDIVRVLTAAFELSHLPNRAELRLKELDRVIGYTLSHVKDDEHGTAGVVMFFKDLTEVEQREERERLRDRLASLGEMAAGIAHELKNPLAGIEVSAGLLRRQVPDSNAAQTLLADIMSEAKLANAIVGEMLEFVRPIRLQVEHANITDVLHQALTLAESKTPRGSVSVKLDIPAGLPPIECDHHQLCQVFTNLIANAFEALDGKGTIAIAASQGSIETDPAFAGDPQEPTPIVIVDVADDGPGVPAELNDRIFDPFFTTKPKGSGLGLGIVRKIVDAHDGRIDLSSSPTTGTRFRVTLPVSSATGVFR
jgi:nitrogen-specific signal transduction histidine kinase